MEVDRSHASYENNWEFKDIWLAFAIIEENDETKQNRNRIDWLVII